MQVKGVDWATVKCFIVGNLFFDVVENFKYDEEGRKQDVKDGIKVTIYSGASQRSF